MNAPPRPQMDAALQRIRARHEPVHAVGGRFDGESWAILLLLGQGDTRCLPVAAARKLAADIVMMADVLEPACEPEHAA